MELQELDLQLLRDKKLIEDMPEIAELARKRKLYMKLKAEATRLFAQRKDIDSDLADLDEREREINEEVDHAHDDVDATNYEEVQDLEIRLSTLAKDLEKVAYIRSERKAQLADLDAKQRQLSDYTARFEESVKAETRAAREKAERTRGDIDRNERKRTQLLSQLDAATRARYLAASDRFHGLAVERLEGEVPSICRTHLQPSSLADLRHMGEVGECPYCHRIIVTPAED